MGLIAMLIGRNLLRRCVAALALAAVAAGAAAQSPWALSYEREVAQDYPGAIEAMAPLSGRQSSDDFVVLRLAWLEYLNGDYNASIRDYRRALELNERSLEAMLGVTLPLLAQQRWREAAAQARSALGVAPYNYYGHVRLMVAEEGLQQWQALAEHASELSARYPSDATILVYLARARAWQGNVAAARAAYERVLERIPGHEEATAYLRDQR
jgi:tetratricopeptide (TPR) repeat protein